MLRWLPYIELVLGREKFDVKKGKGSETGLYVELVANKAPQLPY